MSSLVLRTVKSRIWMLVISIFIGVAQADVLLIEKVEQGDTMQLPANGITMATVESRWGAPASRRSAVGEPPITRWEYADWSVYFEHNLVITSVLNAN